MSFKRLAALLLCIVCAALFLSACNTAAAPTSTAATAAGAANGAPRRGGTPTPVPTLVRYEPAVFTVERGSILSSKSVNGEIVPSKQEILFFRTNGLVSRVTVSSGATVKKGDLLAEQQVEDVLNQLQQARIDLSVAQAAFEKAKSDRVYAADKAKIDLEVATHRRDLAKIDVNNSVGIARQRAQINLDIAEQNVKLAELNLKLAGDTSSLKEEQTVERQKLAVQRLELLLAERQIVAPFDGVILRVVISAGNQATAFNTAIEIGDPAELVVRSPSDSKLDTILNRDTEVLFSFTSTSKENKRVNFLPNFLPFNTAKDAKQTAFIASYNYFSIPGDIPRSQLKIGAAVILEVIIGRKDNVLLLPPAAVRSYRGLNFVIVQDGDRRRRVEISAVGLQTEKIWEIEADLKPGDRVIGQ